MNLDDTGHAGRWSPDGETILFVATPLPNHHKAICSLAIGEEADGAISQLPIAPGCGGLASDPDAYGCYSPAWSPDGDRIVFTRSEGNGSNESIWIVNADGKRPRPGHRRHRRQPGLGTAPVDDVSLEWLAEVSRPSGIARRRSGDRRTVRERHVVVRRGRHVGWWVDGRYATGGRFMLTWWPTERIARAVARWVGPRGDHRDGTGTEDDPSLK